MTAAEMAKRLWEHPEWEVEVETSVTNGWDERETFAAEPDMFEHPETKKFLIFAS